MYSNLCERLLGGEDMLSVIGLGYVGLPLAVAFSKRMRVVGYDLDQHKIEMCKAGVDPTREVGDDAVRAASVEFTNDPADLRKARFHIVAVPTPTHADHTPDLNPLIKAASLVGANLEKGSIVVFESTVYPGTTETVCIPALEAASGLTCGVDFKVGYSPERINPGDPVHRFECVSKVVAGMDGETLEAVARIYGTAVQADIYRAPSIQVAEMAKLLENTQRDANIALVNEAACMCDRLGIDTHAVLEAAATKWNFHSYTPGLVGGHCIGIDSRYLAYSAEKAGYSSELIPVVRNINDRMAVFVAEKTVAGILDAGKEIADARVAVLGFTFKENCPDIRNTGVSRLVENLRSRGLTVLIADPWADKDDVMTEYGVELAELQTVQDVDAVILAVAHDAYRTFTPAELDLLYREGRRVLVDIKGVLNRSAFETAGYLYWRL